MGLILPVAPSRHHRSDVTYPCSSPNRLANTAQRLLLYATERGCTHPDCTVAANCTEVHHITPYAQQPRTHADELTLRCGPHHRLLASGQWTTRKNHHGETETIPPPHLDHGQPRTNRYHHPEKLLHETGNTNNDNSDDDSDDDSDAP